MSYRIAGIDVHKKMLAVVVTDVEIDSEYQFEQRRFGSNPEQLRSLALEQEAEEVVMESTAQYWKPGVGGVGKVLETDMRDAKRRKAEVWNLAFGAGAIQSRTTGTQEGFPRCRTPSEATGGPGVDFEFCTRCRTTSVADGDAQEVPVKVRSNTAAKPIGVSSGRGTY